MTSKGPIKDGDEAVAWATSVIGREQEKIAFLKSHVLPDLSKLPDFEQLLEGGTAQIATEKEMQAMTREELLDYAKNLTGAFLFTIRMQMQADVNRVTSGVHGANRLIHAAEKVANLGEQAKKTKADRRKGLAAKLANDKDGKQAAKTYAIKLWPEARQKGWTADRLHMEITREGYAVKADTVRKWLTKLRRTGTC